MLGFPSGIACSKSRSGSLLWSVYAVASGKHGPSFNGWQCQQPCPPSAAHALILGSLFRYLPSCSFLFFIVFTVVQSSVFLQGCTHSWQSVISLQKEWAFLANLIRHKEGITTPKACSPETCSPGRVVERDNIAGF